MGGGSVEVGGGWGEGGGRVREGWAKLNETLRQATVSKSLN